LERYPDGGQILKVCFLQRYIFLRWMPMPICIFILLVDLTMSKRSRISYQTEIHFAASFIHLYIFYFFVACWNSVFILSKESL
jgi:membrane-associated protease RseP (regulator of RpoE activity)